MPVSVASELLARSRILDGFAWSFHSGQSCRRHAPVGLRECGEALFPRLENLNRTPTRGHVVDGKIAHFQVTLKIGFTLDGARETP